MPKLAGTAVATRGSAPPTTSGTTAAPKTAPTLDEGLLFEFTPLDETIDFLNILWWGPEGSGKTTDIAAMADLPGDGITILINAEGGAKKGALRKRGIDTSKIVIWPDPDKGQVLNFENLEAMFFHLESMLKDNPGCVKALAWDSLTEITTKVLEQQVAKSVARNANRDRWATDRDDYRVMSDQIRTLIRKYRDLPCHFGATALVREDDENGITVLGPKMSPALASDVRGYVDLVIYTKSDEIDTDDGVKVIFKGATRGTSRFRAKDRFDATPRVLYDPTAVRVAAYVNGDITEEEDPVQAEALEWRQQAAAKIAAIEKAKAERKAAVRSGARKPAATSKTAEAPADAETTDTPEA